MGILQKMYIEGIQW